MDSFRAVIALWRTPDALAQEIGVSIYAARKWRDQDNIPSKYWKLVVRAAQQNKFPVTYERLAELASLKLAEVAA